MPGPQTKKCYYLGTYMTVPILCTTVRAEICKGAHVGPQVEVALGSKGHGEHQWGLTLLETSSAGRRSGGKGGVTVREEEKVADEGRCEKSSEWGYYERGRGQVSNRDPGDICQKEQE